jgi:porin
MLKFKSSLMSACVLLAATAAGSAFADVATPSVVATPDSAAASTPMGATQGSTLHTQSMAADAGTSPYTLKLQYTGELADNADGGIKTGGTYMQNVDAQFAVDTAKAFGLTGGRIFLEGFYETPQSMDTKYVGAIQDESWIDTSGTEMFRLYQAYYDQNLGNTDILLGIYDLQTEFGNTKPMDIFFNGAYAWNTVLDQSGLAGQDPSTYPNTSPALRVRQKLNDQWSVQGAVTDGIADNPKHPGINDVLINKQDGAFAIGEVDYTPIAHTKIMAGYWGYTGKFDTFDEANRDGSTRQVYGSNGGYIGGATRLYTQEGRRVLDGFANLGLGDPTTNEVDRSLNLGLNYTGLLDARPNDRMGVAMGVAGVSDPYRKAQIAAGSAVEHYETNFEATYRAPINSWATVQPDVQYWVNPNVDPTMKNDLLFMVHFEIGHLFNM